MTPQTLTKLFWIAVIASGAVGLRIGPYLADRISSAVPSLSVHWPLTLFVCKVLTAAVFFLVLILPLNAVAAIATKSEIRIDTQSLIRGTIYSALIPFILGILGFLLLFILAGSGMHDSL
jgi:hypothetical protein